MPVPILRQGRTLIASVQSSLTDSELQRLAADLGVRTGNAGTTGVVVDVTQCDVIDSYAVRMLRNIAHVVRLRGARMVVVGIQPGVAFSMVQLGLTFEGIDTALDLDDGLALLGAAGAGGPDRG